MTDLMNYVAGSAANIRAASQTHAANVPLPVGWIPCMTLFPPNPIRAISGARSHMPTPSSRPFSRYGAATANRNWARLKKLPWQHCWRGASRDRWTTRRPRGPSGASFVLLPCGRRQDPDRAHRPRGGRKQPPERIVCLTEETVETLYLLGEQDRIVGISGYCVRPPEARREKPRVSAFTSADIPKIIDLRPDLVLSFSDLQAEIVATLIRHGIAVHAFNQRSIAEIFDMIRTLGALVGASYQADRLAEELAAGLADARRRAMQLPRRPKVYFEEWDEPMISGIAWVSELIDIAGGIDIFADRAAGKSAVKRIVTLEEIIAREPDIIIGSWCGKKFRAEKVAARPGFERIPAVRNQALYEIKSPIILQPGPAALTAGLAELQRLLTTVVCG